MAIPFLSISIYVGMDILHSQHSSEFLPNPVSRKNSEHVSPYSFLCIAKHSISMNNIFHGMRLPSTLPEAATLLAISAYILPHTMSVPFQHHVCTFSIHHLTYYLASPMGIPCFETWELPFCPSLSVGEWIYSIHNIPQNFCPTQCLVKIPNMFHRIPFCPLQNIAFQ